MLQDPDDFCHQASKEQRQLRERLVKAAQNLSKVHMPPDVRLQISEICSLLDVDGIRGDIVTNRAAKAVVALEGRQEVTLQDVEKVIGLCLNHRYSQSLCHLILFPGNLLVEQDAGTVIALYLHYRCSSVSVLSTSVPGDLFFDQDVDQVNGLCLHHRCNQFCSLIAFICQQDVLILSFHRCV